LAYAINIERHGADGKRVPISLAEWEEALAETDDVRLIEGRVKLGHGIEIENPGATEFLDHADGSWKSAFHWSPSGRASFDAGDAFDDAGSGFGKLVRLLTAMLGAPARR
jgi:hypothetical protein